MITNEAENKILKLNNNLEVTKESKQSNNNNNNELLSTSSSSLIKILNENDNQQHLQVKKLIKEEEEEESEENKTQLKLLLNKNNSNNFKYVDEQQQENKIIINRLNNHNNNYDSLNQKIKRKNENLNLETQQQQIEKDNKLKQLRNHMNFNNIDINSNNNSPKTPTTKMNDLNNKDDGYVDDDDDIEEKKCNLNNNNNNNNNNESDSKDDSDNEPLDPRIQIELERLNKSSSDINHLENELDEAKQLFITTKNKQAQRLEYLQKKLGSCIVKSKPYFDTLQATEKLQKETQRAVQEFQKAISHYKAAKETLAVAEQTLNSNGISDVWQEYLSETIKKINASKKNADLAEEYHRNKMLEYQMSEKRLQFLEDDLKRNIAKSKSYYEEKDRWQMQMEAQKTRINELERALNDSKYIYSEAMKALRLISDEIHISRRTRKIRLKEREPCVGAEKPDNFYENLDDYANTSKSLENMRNDTDSYDENLKEESSSIGKMSLTANEKRTQFVFNSQNNNQQSLEYYSFGVTTSAPSSRCSSPSNKDNENNNNNNNDTSSKENIKKLTSQSESRIIIGESNENLSTDQINKTELNLNNNEKIVNNNNDKNQIATKIIISNPKINKSSSLYFSNSLKSSNQQPKRLPNIPNNNSNNNNNKVRQETPLLANLLLYNSAISKITNIRTNDNRTTNK